MSLLDLAQTKTDLDIRGATWDGRIQRTIDAAEGALASKVGPLEPTPTTLRLRPSGGVLVLDQPALTLTSVTPRGGSAITTGMYLDPDSGIVELDSGCFARGVLHTVVYSRGRDPLPPELREAAEVLFQHMWEVQLGTGGRSSGASDGASNSIPGAGYLFPNRVLSLIEPHLIVPI